MSQIESEIMSQIESENMSQIRNYESNWCISGQIKS